MTNPTAKTTLELAADTIIAYFNTHGTDDARAGAFNILDRLKDEGLTISALHTPASSVGVDVREALHRELRISSDHDHRSWNDIERAFAARTPPSQQSGAGGIDQAIVTLVEVMDQTSQMAYERAPEDFGQFGEPSYIKDARRAIGTLATALGRGLPAPTTDTAETGST